MLCSSSSWNLFPDFVILWEVGFSRRGAFVCAAEIPLHFFDTVVVVVDFVLHAQKRGVKHTRSQPGLFVGTVGASAAGEQHTSQ
jgi:hypothetical protein